MANFVDYYLFNEPDGSDSCFPELSQPELQSRF